MTIRIVTDSTCDLPEEIAAELGITIVPLYINFGNDSYLDRIDLSREAFYARLPDCDPPPTTAIPGPQMFLEAYERLADERTADLILSAAESLLKRGEVVTLLSWFHALRVSNRRFLCNPMQVHRTFSKL